MKHVLEHLGALPAAPLPGEQPGGPEAANSGVPKARGQGMGGTPMSSHAHHVPLAKPAAPLCWGNAGSCDASTPCATPCAATCATATAAAPGRAGVSARLGAAGGAQALPDGNHGDNKNRSTTE